MQNSMIMVPSMVLFSFIFRIHQLCDWKKLNAGNPLDSNKFYPLFDLALLYKRSRFTRKNEGTSGTYDTSGLNTLMFFYTRYFKLAL